MDLAAAFPEFGGSSPFYEPPMYQQQQQQQQQPHIPQHQSSQSQGYQQQGQATFAAALQTTQTAEQPVIYGSSGPPALPQMPPSTQAPSKKQGFADMEGGSRSRRDLQYKKALYTVLTFLLALSLDRIVGIYLDDYLASAGFEPNRTFLTWMVYPAILIAALWIVLR